MMMNAHDILAWLDAEQRKAERWRYSNGETGVFRFGLTGPELNRIRHALSESDGEWQCRFVADDKRCCQLPKGHVGDHTFSVAQGETAERLRDNISADSGICQSHRDLMKPEDGCPWCEIAKRRLAQGETAPAPVSACGAKHTTTGAVCVLAAGHAENHRGSLANGSAQWFTPRIPAAASPVPAAEGLETNIRKRADHEARLWVRDWTDAHRDAGAREAEEWALADRLVFIQEQAVIYARRSPVAAEGRDVETLARETAEKVIADAWSWTKRDRGARTDYLTGIILAALRVVAEGRR